VFDPMYASWAVATEPWILPLALIGILATLAGVALLMWTGRRRFNRRNVAGVQEFSSYGQSVGHRLAESLVDSFGGLVMAVGLLALFGAGYTWYLQRY
jgi:type II secretory pathway pseudopilin PulG